MDKAVDRTNSVEQRRYVNIVYFIESSRSYTMRLNLRYARWALAGGVLLCTWALGSFFWIFQLEYQISATRNRLQSALTTIFEYQIKNDKVFEQAYPSSATSTYYSEASQLSSNNPTQEQNANKDLAARKAAVNSLPPATASEAASKTLAANDAKNSTPPASPAEGPAKTANKSQEISEGSQVKDNAQAKKDGSALEQFIAISQPKISKTGPNIHLTFDITNKAPAKAEGYIWSIALITYADSKTKYFVAPEHTGIDANTGAIKSPKSAYQFSIQRFKNKTFDFKIAATQDWKLTKLTLSFTDLQAKKIETVEIPVEKLAVNKNLEVPLTDIKL